MKVVNTHIFKFFKHNGTTEYETLIEVVETDNGGFFEVVYCNGSKEFKHFDKNRAEILIEEDSISVNIGDRLTAKENIPEMMGHGISFMEGNIYTVKNVKGNSIGVLDHYGNIDYFSLVKDSKSSNYLWGWFKK